jgi:sec-independent protein translocase protein TatA
MFRSIGPPEIILIIVVLLLLFGAKRLPDLSRSVGRSLRIFKSEVKEMGKDDDKDADTGRTTQSTPSEPAPPRELEGRVQRADETTPRPAPDPERRDA